MVRTEMTVKTTFRLIYFLIDFSYLSSSRNTDSQTELYSDIVCLDRVESEVLEGGIETDPHHGKV